MKLIELIDKCFKKDKTIINLKFKLEGFEFYISNYKICYFYISNYKICYRDGFGFKRELKSVDIYELNSKIEEVK